MISIAVVDDNPKFIDEVGEKLSLSEDIKIGATAQSGEEFLEKIKEGLTVDLVLMDISMPGMGGIQATHELMELKPAIKIVMFTTFDNDENIVSAISVGASGYLLKSSPMKQLDKYIRDTLNGGAAVTPSIALRLLKLLKTKTVTESPKTEGILSSREEEVLINLSKGYTYKEIADKLFLAPGTIRKHMDNIYRKLQVNNKTQALAKAKSQGIL